MKRCRADERGYTAIELIVCLVLLVMIGGAMSAVYVNTATGSAADNDRIAKSNDAQLIAAFLVRDAQASGGTEPVTLQLDSTLGVSTAAASASDCPHSGSLVARFAWRDRYVDPTRHVQTSDKQVASYYLDGANLVRATCKNGAATSARTLAHQVHDILPSHVATCFTNGAPSACEPALPDWVQLTVEEADNLTASAPYVFTLNAAVRPDGNAPAPPTGTPSAFPAILALGGGVCNGGNGVVGVNANGNTSAYIGGAIVVDATDSGGCHAMEVSNNATCSANSISILQGGTLQGNSSCSTAQSFPSPLADPLAWLPPPPGANNCTGGSNPAQIGGHYQPGIYQQALSVTSTATFDPGIYIFCNGLSISAQATVTANNVLFYFAGGTLAIAGGASVSMSGPSTGTYSNIVIWIPVTNPTTALTINGGASVVNNYRGVMYAPNVDVTLSGNEGSSFAGIIARSVTFTGTGRNVVGPVFITGPSALVPWTVGRQYPNTPITASGGTTPYTWSASGLPNGMTISTSTGVISGTPTASGSFTVTVTAADAAGNTGQQAFPLTINQAPAITAVASLPNWTKNVAYPNEQMQASFGTGSLAWTASNLPPGLSINASTGLISGTPTQPGTYNVTVTVTDDAGAAATQNYNNVVINPSVVITTGSLPNWTVNRPNYSATVAATGGTPPDTWSASGLPRGLSIDSATGVISGTPSRTGTSTVTVTITDSVGARTTQTYSITINDVPTVTSPASPLAPWTKGRQYPDTPITESAGTGPYTWSATGLPAGMSITTTGSGGLISGTPTQNGTFSVVVTVTDAAGATGSKTYSLTINDVPAISTASLPAAHQGTAYSTTVAASAGTTPYAWAASGLPVGLNIDANTGVISGTTSVIGSFSVTITVTDSAGASASKALTLAVQSTPTAGSTNPTALPQGATAQDITITGTNFAAGATASFSGTGVTVNSTTFVDSAHVTANVTIAGNATTGARTITVTNPDGGSASVGFTINAKPSVTSTNPASRGQGATNQNITITGTGFVNGATATFSGAGITVVSTSFVSATQLTAKISIASNAPTGARNVTVTNPDSGAGVGTNVFTVNAAPTVTGTNPSSRGQGATNQNVTITGTGFVNGASATFSGAGITVVSTTFVNATQLTAKINVATGATIGAGDVTVTNPDFGAGTGPAAFTVTAGPTITSPNAGAPANITHSTTATFTITGTGFVSGATVTVSGGFTVNTVTFVDSAHLSVQVTAGNNGQRGTYNLTVTNPDGGSVTQNGAIVNS